MGRVLHSKTIAVDITDHVSSQMKKKLLTKIIESRSKINVLADESTHLGQKSTLIIFLKTSVDGEAAPASFPLDLVDLETLCASHIKDAILDCLRKNGFTTKLLQELLIQWFPTGEEFLPGEEFHEIRGGIYTL